MSTTKRKPLKPRRTARRVTVAAKLAAGQTQEQVAAELGCSRSTIERDVASDEMRQIGAALVSAAFLEVEQLFIAGLRTIKGAFEANKGVAVAKMTYKNGKPVSRTNAVLTLGPDWLARLSALSHVERLLKLGRPLPKLADDKSERPLTLDEIEAFLTKKIAACKKEA